MSSIELPRVAGHIDWDRACRRVPKGWYWLASAGLSCALWFGLATLLQNAV